MERTKERYINKFDTDKVRKSKSFMVLGQILLGARVFVKLIILLPFIILGLICCGFRYLVEFFDWLADKLDWFHYFNDKLNEWLWDDFKIAYILLNLLGNKKYFKDRYK